MTLETRLRDELARSAPTDTAAAPSISDLEATVAGRRRRNRVAMLGAAAVCAVAVAGGTIFALLPDGGTDVIATASDQTGSDSDAGSAAAVEEAPSDEAAAVDDATTPEDAATDDSSTAVDDPEATTEPADDTGLQADAGDSITVETRESAVEFAGGSGVLLARTGPGYAGVASAFGGDAGVRAIGLASDNGLDWAEVELTGVPDGATAVALAETDRGYAALFSRFDAARQQNMTYVATSSDLADWSFSDPLPGPDAVASSLLEYRGDLVVFGVAPDPIVWLGTVDTGFDEVGRIVGAETFAGAVAIRTGLVAVGVTADGPTLFDSEDAASWVASPLRGLGAADDLVAVSVFDGTILLAGDGADGAWAASSDDGGQSWSRSDLGASAVDSVATGQDSFGVLATTGDGGVLLTLAGSGSPTTTTLDVAAPDRLSLLTADADEAVILVMSEEGLTWMLAQR